jgi:hypothetical protein
LIGPHSDFRNTRPDGCIKLEISMPASWRTFQATLIHEGHALCG